MGRDERWTVEEESKIDRHLRQTKVPKTGSGGRNICLVILVQDTDREGQ